MLYLQCQFPGSRLLIINAWYCFENWDLIALSHLAKTMLCIFLSRNQQVHWWSWTVKDVRVVVGGKPKITNYNKSEVVAPIWRIPLQNWSLKMSEIGCCVGRIYRSHCIPGFFLFSYIEISVYSIRSCFFCYLKFYFSYQFFWPVLPL